MVVVGVIVGAGLGYALGSLAARQKSSDALAAVREQVATLTATLSEREAASGDRLDSIVLATTTRVSDEIANRYANDVEARLAAQQQVLEAMVAPVGQQLTQLTDVVTKADNARLTAETKVMAYVDSVAKGVTGLEDSTVKLRSALEGGSTRGKWGEFQLELIVERAGLTGHVTWRTQQQATGGPGGLRPDMLISIPGDKVLVIDAKAPTLTLDGDEPSDETDGAYAGRLRDHIKALARKDYVDGVANAVGYVFLFLPSEAAYQGALRADADLLLFAMDRNVAVVSPSTLLSSLTVVESLWRLHVREQHLDEAISEASELHKRLQTFAGYFNKVGDRLGAAVADYNSAVGSLKRSVIPAARRMEAADFAPARSTLAFASIDPDLEVRHLVAADAEEPATDGAPGLAGPDGTVRSGSD